MYRHLPSLNLLRSFEAAGRLLSFKKASEELHVTPSAISHQVKELEEHLDVRLFVRFNRGLELTARGENYLQEVSRALQILSVATRDLRPARLTSLRISSIPSLDSDVIAPRLHQLQSLIPGIGIKLIGDARVLDMEVAQVDVALRFKRDPVVAADMRLMDLYATPVCRPALAEQIRLSPEILLEQPSYRSIGDDQCWSQWFAQQGWQAPETESTMQFNANRSALNAVRQGDGVCMGYLPLVVDWLERGSLVAPFPDRRILFGTIYAVVRPSVASYPEVQQLIGWLKGLLAEYESRYVAFMKAG